MAMQRIDPDSISPQELAPAFIAIEHRVTPRARAAVMSLFSAPNHELPDDGEGQFSEIVMMFGKVGGLLSKELKKESIYGYKLTLLAYQWDNEKTGSVWWKMRRNIVEALNMTWFSSRQARDAMAGDETFYERVSRSMRDDPEDRRQRLATASRIPARYLATVTLFVRNPDVVAEVLNRANGVCEACKAPAPFRRAVDGTPYLEVHHIKWLADGGEDSVANAIALCPNCHRQKHYA
jgi:predicted HNH restriction endonuclease